MHISNEQLIQELKTKFPQYLQYFDTNRDGCINLQELANIVYQIGGGCINWCTASNMAYEIFNKLDKDHNGVLTTQEVQNNCECVCIHVGKITLVSPANGIAFGHFPRHTCLSWLPVPNAVTYWVTVEFDSCGTWCSLINQSAGSGGQGASSFHFDFVGAQRGRWKVAAMNQNNQKIAESDWWIFSYRV